MLVFVALFGLGFFGFPALCVLDWVQRKKAHSRSVRSAEDVESFVVLTIIWIICAVNFLVLLYFGVLHAGKAKSEETKKQITTDKGMPVVEGVQTDAPDTTFIDDFLKARLSPQANYEADCSNSSAILSAEYNAKSKRMYIRFRNNPDIEYILHDFPMSEWNNFIAAESMGNYYNTHIKGKYSGEKIDWGQYWEDYKTSWDGGYQDGWEDAYDNVPLCDPPRDSDNEEYIDGYYTGYEKAMEKQQTEYK